MLRTTWSIQTHSERNGKFLNDSNHQALKNLTFAQQNTSDVRFELIAVSMKIMVFSDAAPCSSVDEYLVCKQRSEVLTTVLLKIQVLLYVMPVIRQVVLELCDL